MNIGKTYLFLRKAHIHILLILQIIEFDKIEKAVYILLLLRVEESGESIRWRLTIVDTWEQLLIFRAASLKIVSELNFFGY